MLWKVDYFLHATDVGLPYMLERAGLDVQQGNISQKKISSIYYFNNVSIIKTKFVLYCHFYNVLKHFKFHLFVTFFWHYSSIQLFNIFIDI